MSDGPELAGAQSRPGEALRHLALLLTQPKGDPLLSRQAACRACGGPTTVESFRDHLEDFFIGRSYGHVCRSCGKRFRTETLWASFARTLGATVLAGLAWLFWFVSGTTNDVIAFLLATLAAFVVAQRVQRIRNRWFSPRRVKHELASGLTNPPNRPS
jgi:hypothetical protein